MTLHLPTKTIRDYGPSEYLPVSWAGTALDILRVAEIPVEHRLAVVLREGWLPATILAAFAQRCAAEVTAEAKGGPGTFHASYAIFYAGEAKTGQPTYRAAYSARYAGEAAKSAIHHASMAYTYIHKASYADIHEAYEAACERQVATLIRLLEEGG